MLVVGASTELHARAGGIANGVAGTGVVLVVGTGAAGAVVLLVVANAVLDGRAAGETDLEASTGVVLAVAVDGGGIIVVVVVRANNRQTVLWFNVRTYSRQSMWFWTYQLRSRQNGRGTNGQSKAQSGRERESVRRHCWIFGGFEYRARRKGIHEVLKEMVRLSEKERVEELAPEKDRRTNDCSGVCCRMDDDEKRLDRRHCSLCSFWNYPGDRGVSRGGRRARNKASARPGTSPWWLP